MNNRYSCDPLQEGNVSHLHGAHAHGAHEPELEGIVEEQATVKAADEEGQTGTAAENGEGSKTAEEQPEKEWYKDALVCIPLLLNSHAPPCSPGKCLQQRG